MDGGPNETEKMTGQIRHRSERVRFRPAGQFLPERLSRCQDLSGVLRGYKKKIFLDGIWIDRNGSDLNSLIL